MKVTGFTFIKDAVKYEYPIVEAIKSILPICDEFVVAVGKSSDDTMNLILGIDDPKIRIIETIWDESVRQGGRVLALETDKAFAAISDDTDWAFYIQGDEIVHEKYLDTILDQMKRYKGDKKVDGLLFHYKHFYGSYDYVGSSSNWYKHEIRVIRNDKSIYSYRDAQGFRKGDNQKLNVKPIDAYVYHYGWVKKPDAMQNKLNNFGKYWHEDRWIDENVGSKAEFDYNSIDELQLFKESHPAVMLEKIKAKNWTFDYDISMTRFPIQERFKKIMKNYFGWTIGYKNYKVV
jgi:hypothetical protein